MSPMAVTQQTLVLNDFGEVKSQIRRRTSKTGKTTDRVTIDISSEPVVHMFDDRSLGADVANAIRDKLERDIKNITATASASTLRWRQYAKRAFAEGSTAKSVAKRYSGGRIGPKEPAQTVRLFNDSGRLAEGLFVRQNTRAANSLLYGLGQPGYWTVNVPANRFTDGSKAGLDNTQHLVSRLAQFVPALKNPRELLSDPKVVKEIQNSIQGLLVKAKREGDVKRARLRLQRWNAAKAAFGLVRGLA